MKKLILVILILSIFHTSFSQETWDLLKCVNYALEHNISVRQADVQARLSALELKQSKAMIIPTLSANTQGGYNFGRSINPTTNQFTTNTVLFQSYNIQSGVTLFNFFNIKNSIKSAKAQSDADNKDINRVKSDVTLNVAAAYLQYLQSLEQVNIAKGQIDLTKQQLDLTNKQVQAGSLPELNAAQLESQLSTDSSTLITNQATMNQNKLQLLALLDLSADQPFDVSLPDVDNIPLEPISELDPANLYKIALKNQYQQKVDSLKVLSAVYASKSAKAQMYPTLSAFGTLSSNYSNQYMIPTGKNIIYPDTIVNLNINGQNYYQIQNVAEPIYGKASYGKQIFNINRSEAVGITLNIPILNNRQLKTAYEKSKENITAVKLQQELNNQTLQQNIYTAFNNATAGIEGYTANTKAEAYAQYAYDLAQKRYDIGMLSASDYLVAANNLYTAKINRAESHYEYIFRLKVLEFYKFNQISLSGKQ